MIYFDHNATYPIRSSVIDTVTDAQKVTGNPSSVHSAGRAAKSLVEDARVKVAALVGSRARDIVFTGSGTEANNAVIRADHIDTVIISAIEHDCVLQAAKISGKTVITIPVTADGLLDIDVLRRALDQCDGKKTLVSVMLANNETGVIQPITDIAALVKEYGAFMHTDAVQAAGKIAIDMTNLGVDYLTLSAHKIGGPQGVGALVLAPTAPMNALVTGGGQELGRRSGTENVAGITGFGVAAIEALGELQHWQQTEALRNRMETEIKSISNTCHIISDMVDRLPNTSCIIMPGVKGETQVMHFDLNGICVSSGSACSSGKVKTSHVLTALGISDAEAGNSVRISLGLSNSEQNVDRFIHAWRDLYTRTAARAS